MNNFVSTDFVWVDQPGTAFVGGDSAAPPRTKLTLPRVSNLSVRQVARDVSVRQVARDVSVRQVARVMAANG